MVFNEVQADLENEGYEVQALLLPASAVGADHERYRVWFIAYSNSNREMVQGGHGNSGDKERNGKTEIQKWENEFFGAMVTTAPTEKQWLYNSIKRRIPILHNGNDGFPDRLVDRTFSKWKGEAIKAAGNAIVPQVAYEIFKVIQEMELKHLHNS